jgi:hypothetical protein
MKGASARVADEDGMCIQNNGSATFVDFGAAGNYRRMDRSLAPHECSFPPLEVVNLPQAAGTEAPDPGGVSAHGLD